ncbi:MAG: hypothetical protein LQ351_007946 [Letrouitia transgressa]|nr:MAG: hypothetical protein LQ351_007946 [Letrouitia transgressa]
MYPARYRNKIIDLSNPIRLSGLSPGAKLELVVLSRSPSVVSVALQLLNPTDQGSSDTRLTDQFPSSTTLWLVLRKFELSAPHRNYTARHVSKFVSGDNGAGRLYYESPVLNIMGREISSFTDLQKTLAQFGFNSGSVLLRLSFRASETPLEEALERMGHYFNPAKGDEKARLQAGSDIKTQSEPGTLPDILTEDNGNVLLPSRPGSPPKAGDDSNTVLPTSDIHPKGEKDSNDLLPSRSDPPLENPPNSNLSEASSVSKPLAENYPPPTSSPTGTTPDQRAFTIYAPSSSATPKAARQAFNENDYEPTIAHAKLHQSRLAQSGRNKTLLSDNEILAQQRVQAKKLAEITSIEIKIRFPDQWSAVREFTSSETARSLYDFVRGLLDKDSEPFLLSFTSAKGPKTVPYNSTEKLISDIGMTGKTLVNFQWDLNASSGAKTSPVLQDKYSQRAKEIEVKEIPEVDEPEKDDSRVGLSNKTNTGEQKRKAGVPKWLKLSGRN